MGRIERVRRDLSLRARRRGREPRLLWSDPVPLNWLADNAEQFRNSNLVLMASRTSAAPTIRDAEWQELDHRVFMMFYSILMHGMPKFGGGTAAHGGMSARMPLVLHVSKIAQSRGRELLYAGLGSLASPRCVF